MPEPLVKGRRLCSTDAGIAHAQNVEDQLPPLKMTKERLGVEKTGIGHERKKAEAELVRACAAASSPFEQHMWSSFALSLSLSLSLSPSVSPSLPPSLSPSVSVCVCLSLPLPPSLPPSLYLCLCLCLSLPPLEHRALILVLRPGEGSSFSTAPAEVL